MNKYYSYPNIEMWQGDRWRDRISPADTLVQWIQKHDVIRNSGYLPFTADDPFTHPLFREKIMGIDDPSVVESLQQKGIHYFSTEQGGKRWIAALPQKALDWKTPLPFLVVPHREDYGDPWWAMKAVGTNRPYLDMMAASHDFALIILATDGPDEDRIWFNILQEATILYPCDLERLYLDISKIVSSGGSLSEIPGFTWTDREGSPVDPDAAAEAFGPTGVPVLNIAGRWSNGDSLLRGLIMTFAMNEGKFDREWLVHSAAGKKMAEGLVIDYDYASVEDPKLARYFEDIGLRLDVRETKGQRWTIMTPLQAFEEPDVKLPAVLVMQEMYRGNEHLAVTAKSYFRELCEISAQGECILLFFALEDVESNDLFAEIAEEAARHYPIDLARIYVTGHSHDGYFSYMFAARHPDLIAGYAALGIPPCSFAMNEVPDYTADSPLREVDMPCITLCGLEESRFPADDGPDLQRWIDEWQRYFRILRIPQKSAETLREAFNSPDSTTRITGLPGDRTETVWADGFEHYIADFRNADGNWHFRAVRSQNMPHTTTPFMLTAAWSFLRRFARDPKTGRIIERY